MQRSVPSNRSMRQQILQKGRQRRAAVLPCLRNCHELICRQAWMQRIVLHRISIRICRMAVRNEQLRMVKWRRLVYHALVSKRIPQKINQIGFFLHGKAERHNVGIDQRNLVKAIWEVTATVVKLHYLFQRELPAIMEIRRSECDIAQHRCLKVSDSRNIVIAAEWRGRKAVTNNAVAGPGWNRNHQSRRVAYLFALQLRLRKRQPGCSVHIAQAYIFNALSDANVVKTIVVDANVEIAHYHAFQRSQCNVAHGGVRELRPAMAANALAFCLEREKTAKLALCQRSSTH